MNYQKVVGRQIDGGWVLFKLPDKTAAFVEPDGNVGFFCSWAQALRFTMIDARGAECVPPEELRKAVDALKQVDASNERYHCVSEERKRVDRGGSGFLDKLEEEHEEWCRHAGTHSDGRLVWAYDDDED